MFYNDHCTNYYIVILKGEYHYDNYPKYALWRYY